MPIRQAHFVTLLSIGLVSSYALAQYPAQPPVGGSSVFDNQRPSSSAPGPGSGHQRVGPLTATPQDFAELKIAPGFLLSIEVYDEPELTTELRVDKSGTVKVPMIGNIQVSGMTLPQASNAIGDALKEKKILVDPQVNLNVEEYAGTEVTILGEVHTPGQSELLAPRPLDDVLALAGGTTEYAGSTVEIRHTGEDGQKQLVLHNRASESFKDISVAPGDTVTVPRAGIVYVLGGVLRPGGYLMQENGRLDVPQAIALAYGTTMAASVGSMRLIRKKADGTVQEIPIKYHQMVKGEIPPMFLQAEDVIYVPISRVKTVLSAGLLNSAVSAAVIYR